MTAAASGESLQAAVLRQLLLARATALARAGRYQAAEELLSAGAGELGAAALDLLARIRAQQGRYGEAEDLWQQAAQLEPGNPAYAASLRLLRGMAGRPVWLHGVATLLLGGVLLLAVLLVLIAVFSGRGPATDTQTRGRVGAVVEEATAKAAAGPPTVLLEDPSVEVRKEGAELVVRFRSGLFSRGARLTPEGREALARVARQLEPHSSRLLIRVVGHTDNTLPPAGYRYRDNAGLGFERARVAAERLRASAKLPNEAIALASRGEEAPLFSNETRESRARNRTVVLRLGWRGP